MVNIYSWNGENKDLFIKVIEAVLEPVVGDVRLYVPHKKNAEPKPDGDFQIYIWSSPNGEAVQEVPEKIFGVPVSCKDESFKASGQGKAIMDDSYAVAELVGINLYIHHDVCHHGSEAEVKLFRRILEETAELIQSEAGEGAPLNRRVDALLRQGFVYSEEMARILSLAMSSNKNAIVFGPAGHAKSAMVQAVIDGLGFGDETFFQFFGEGMDEARLFGGLNFRKLEEEKILEYFPEKSFLNCRVAVFEELFDAPASVLLALKDTLTAGELRNGSQRFKMKTEVILVLTNKDPDEISDLGPAAHALVERFPLQLNLKWPNYTAESYLRMFKKVEKRMKGPALNGFAGILSEILAKATAEGNFVSPRTAVHAYEICQASARMRGATEVGQQDLSDLRFLPGLESLGESIKADLKAAIERECAKAALAEVSNELEVLKSELEDSDTPIKALKAAKKLGELHDKASNLAMPDALIERRDNLRQSVGKFAAKAQAKAMDLTRV